MSAVVKTRSWDVLFLDGYRLTVLAATARRAATAAAVLRHADDHPLFRGRRSFISQVRHTGDALTRDISEDIFVEEDLPRD